MKRDSLLREKEKRSRVLAAFLESNRPCKNMPSIIVDDENIKNAVPIKHQKLSSCREKGELG